MRSGLSIAAVLLSGALWTGCATRADRDQVSAVSATFLSALHAHGGGLACAQLSSSLRKQVVHDEHEPNCARAILKVSAGVAKLRAVRVYATSARVDLAGGESMFLGQMREGWRIEALGCRPRGNGPYDCQERA